MSQTLRMQSYIKDQLQKDVNWVCSEKDVIPLLSELRGKYSRGELLHYLNEHGYEMHRIWTDDMAASNM